MVSVNLNQILPNDDDDPLYEAGVRYWIKQMRRDKPIPMPVLMQKSYGRFLVLDGRKRIEAAKRLRDETLKAIVVGKELTPEEFLELRRDLQQRRSETN